MSIKILTNHPGRAASPSWREHATYVATEGDSLWSALIVAMRLFVQRANYDCVVLGAGKSDLLYGLFQTLFPFRRRPTVLIDCLWYERQNRYVQSGKKALMKAVDRSVDRYCVWASREIEAYSQCFGLPAHKFVFVPYHTTLPDEAIDVRDGGYLFAGGDSGRDYETLINAMRGVPATLHIASMKPESFDRLNPPPNVVVRRYSSADYLKMMAGCSVNIVALAPGLLHSAGQQTFLNSMSMGKPTIVTDPAGASDYIEDGVDGLLVEPGDPEALRSAILKLLSDPELAQRVGANALGKAGSGYSTEDHFKHIIAVVEGLLGIAGCNGGVDTCPTARLC